MSHTDYTLHNSSTRHEEMWSLTTSQIGLHIVILAVAVRVERVDAE